MLKLVVRTTMLMTTLAPIFFHLSLRNYALFRWNIIKLKRIWHSNAMPMLCNGSGANHNQFCVCMCVSMLEFHSVFHNWKSSKWFEAPHITDSLEWEREREKWNAGHSRRIKEIDSVRAINRPQIKRRMHDNQHPIKLTRLPVEQFSMNISIGMIRSEFFEIACHIQSI